LKSEKHLKKQKRTSLWEKPNIIAIESLLTAIVVIYYISSLIQFIMLNIISHGNASLANSGILLAISYSGQEELSIFQQALFISIPYLLAVILIEVTNFLVKRPIGAVKKTFFLFVQLSLFSFFLFSLLLFVISLIFSIRIVDSWQMLILQIKPDFQYKILIALSITIVIFGYFGSVLGRLKNYFSSQESNNS
jgi:hypothetical protein